MKRPEEESAQAARLRWRAEEILKGEAELSSAALEGRSLEELQRTIHELRVYQIELTMQNDELLKAQLELDEARARYFDLYDLAPVGYCIVSQGGVILEANLTAVTLLGVARAALLKQPITRFILREDQDVYYLYRKRFLEIGYPGSCELRMIRRDGTAFWVRLAATVAPGEAGSLDSDAPGAPVVRLVMSDITDRKQVEEEKARLEAQLRNAHKHHPASLQPEPTRGGKRGAKSLKGDADEPRG